MRVNSLFNFGLARLLAVVFGFRYLTDDAAVAEYMTAVLEANDPDFLLLALGDVTRTRGMAQIAKDARDWAARAFTRPWRPGPDCGSTSC